MSLVSMSNELAKLGRTRAPQFLDVLASPSRGETGRMRRAILCIALVLSATRMPALAADTLTAQDAAAHVGETATVCGTVMSANYAAKSKGQPTFLNFDRPYPNQIFTVMIWGSDRAKFGEPENNLVGKKVCATGSITSYRGKPEIIATNPKQLTTK
jgi:hypothetical protein